MHDRLHARARDERRRHARKDAPRPRGSVSPSATQAPKRSPPAPCPTAEASVPRRAVGGSEGNRMSTLVVIGYDDRYRAEEVRLSLMKMQKDYLIDLADAVVAVKDEKGKVRLNQAVNVTAAGALSGGFWGTLIGLIFLNPLLGLAVGAGAGAVSGALTDL